ncbi:MAG: site-specific integrase [Eubacteriales bacterium]|nr:site-specific integrase [Eubacteriales bacterium]
MAQKGNSRKSSGMGTIRKKTIIRNGTEYTYWEGRYTVGYDTGTGKQIQKSVSGKTQKEVSQKIKQLSRTVDEDVYSEPSRMTVGEWLQIWQAEYLVGVAVNTAHSYRSDCRNHIIPALGAVQLSKLTPIMIQKFYNGLRNKNTGEPLNPKTVRDIHGTFHRALNKAVALDLIARNPADVSNGKIELPRAEEKERVPMEDDEVSRFIEEIEGHKYRLVYLVTLFTGLREGEVLGLSWDRIDWKHNTIQVKQQLLRDREAKKYCIGPPKRRKTREIRVADEVMGWLREQQAEQERLKKLAGKAWNNEWNLVFTREFGSHLVPCTVYENFKRIVKELDMGEQRVHDLRHAYATNSLGNGDDPETVRKNLGHYSIIMLDRYGHRKSTMAIASASRMSSYIREVLPKARLEA